MDDRQNMFVFGKKGSFKALAGGTSSWKNVKGNCLVSKWRYGDNILSPLDIVARLGLERAFPKIGKAIHLPDHFWVSDRKMEIQYGVSMDNPMMGGSAATLDRTVRKLRSALARQRDGV